MSMSAVLCNRAEGLNFQILTNLNIKANGRERWKSWLRRQKVFFKLDLLELASWWQSYEKLLEKDRLNWIWKNYSNQIEISNRQIWKCFLCLAVSLFFLQGNVSNSYVCPFQTKEQGVHCSDAWAWTKNNRNLETESHQGVWRSSKAGNSGLKKTAEKEDSEGASRLRKWIWYI